MADMTKVLQERLAKCQSFDKTFAPNVEGAVTSIKEVAVKFSVDDSIETDKSVKAHMRSRTKRIKGIMDRFVRDLEAELKVIKGDTEEAVVEQADTTVEATAETTEAPKTEKVKGDK